MLDAATGLRRAASVGMTCALFIAASVRSATSMIAEARGDCDTAATEYLGAAQEWAAVDNPFEAGSAFLGAARCLARLGRDANAQIPLESARAIFTELTATPWLAAV